MKVTTKIKAFTLGEMIVVLLLTTIVVGLAFSVLTLVQKQLSTLQGNLVESSQIKQLETNILLDFNRYPETYFNEKNEELNFISPIDTLTYWLKEKVIKNTDTLEIQLYSKQFFFAGKEVDHGAIDAVKLTFGNDKRNVDIFVFRPNDAKIFIDNGISAR